MEGSLRMKRVMKNHNTIAFDGHSNSTAISPVKKGMEKRKLFEGEVGNINYQRHCIFLKGVVSCFDITPFLPDQAKIKLELLCS